MHPIGYNTGALCKGDWQLALDLLKDKPFSVIEIGLLKGHDFFRFVEEESHAIDLSMYDHISIHAPKLKEVGIRTEKDLVRCLKLLPGEWNITHHPDSIKDFSLWEEFGCRLRLENMDARKRTGKTVEELRGIFKKLPDACMCFDIAHAEHIDGTMELGREMCIEFADKIKQIHLSRCLANSKHTTINTEILRSFSKVAAYFPYGCPIVLECNPLTSISHEIEFMQNEFPRHGIDILWKK